MMDTMIESRPRGEALIKAVTAGLDEARVLVVEDDDAMRLFLEESLREEGYVVSTASNTLSAIVGLMCDRVDVTIVDWKMPDLDGFALLSAVQRCFTRVPVIFVTGYPERLLTGTQLEPAFVISKPFDPDLLRAAIAQALDTVSI